jgi:very-short-patch-repair endonuclease
MEQQEFTAFTVGQGRRAGLTDRRMRGRKYARPFHGVRLDAGAELESVHSRAAALSVRLNDHVFFSHATAAHIHGFPLPSHLQRQDAELHICVFEPTRAPHTRGVRSHELKPTGQRVVTVGGLRVIGPEDAWAQLATLVALDDLVVASDWLITGDHPYSGRPPLTTLEAIDRAIARHGRMRGVRSLRSARDSTRYGSLSPQETRLRLLLDSYRLSPPELNFRVRDPSGQLVAMVDLAYPEQRVAIEYLGDHHRTDKKVYRDDIRRRDLLAMAGWSVLFTTADDLSDPRLFLTHLRRLLAST